MLGVAYRLEDLCKLFRIDDNFLMSDVMLHWRTWIRHPDVGHVFFFFAKHARLSRSLLLAAIAGRFVRVLSSLLLRFLLSLLPEVFA